jgi:hypothetical protein
MRFAGLSIAIALGMAAAAACSLELDRAIACGDGYVDVLAGEACDPLVESSYVNACLEHPTKHEGVGGCHPRTCQLDFSQCALCGDGRRDPGEECDGEDFGGERCPVDQDGLRCTSDCKIDDSACPTCGNGELDEGEECDFAMNVGGLVMPRPCAGTDDYPALEPPNPLLRYTYGDTRRCSEQCRFDRTGCSFCGNRQIDPERLVDVNPDRYSAEERCDGDIFDHEDLKARYGTACYDMEGVELRPNVSCSNDCLEYVEHTADNPPCCVQKGQPCPAPTDFNQCCHSYAHPDEEACETQFIDMGLAQQVCK